MITCRCGHMDDIYAFEAGPQQYHCKKCGMKWQIVVTEPARTGPNGFVFPAKTAVQILE